MRIFCFLIDKLQLPDCQILREIERQISLESGRESLENFYAILGRFLRKIKRGGFRLP